MEINELAALGYAIAAVLFALLAALMATVWKDRPKAGLVSLACGATAIWAALHAVGSLAYLDDPVIMLVIEWVRNLSWLAALASIVKDLAPDSHRLEEIALRFGTLFIVASLLLVAYYWLTTGQTFANVATVGGGIALSSLGIILAEQVYRNAPFDARSSLKYFCLGIAGIFVYDFVVFSWTVISGEMAVNHWVARGFISAIFVAPLGLAAKRSIRLSLDARFPRQIIFYSVGAVAAGIFVVVLLLGDYYVRTYAGTWGDAVRIILFVLAMMAIGGLLISATVRARFRVFLAKSFFQYKYDYRKEWLRFISTLTGSDRENVADTAVRAVAQIVSSPGGAVWVQEDKGKNYLPVGAWGVEDPSGKAVADNAKLVRFLRSTQWIVDLTEMRDDPARYEGLTLEPWISADGRWWLIVPLLLGQRLLGFMLLQQPRVAPSLNFEDHDLLRTVGRHAATHIEQAESDKRLAESSQFGAYNRLTAFLMHDLNNLIAQQSLVVKNAEKYRHNPEFVDDAIGTIANSVTRMRRLMEQLSSSSEQPKTSTVDVAEVLDRAARRAELRLPKPRIQLEGGDLRVLADAEKLITITEHLIRNAQDATDDEGRIEVLASAQENELVISITDTGCGMTPEFIRERLFRPFDSTKGSESMGIGAYQAREYVRQLGGLFEVTSTVGEGTRFDIRLPVAS
ncbi:MAG: PEP-CTERM system histidine kinase PrsK [Gammaproteobacteria bacterium]|nr:PEP-CTERM system histidine kinase PrsK [Gammaproteobacteria bacterium]